jgi:streptomycin 6-kinase
MESEHESEGLRFWGGDPTVRLFDVDDDLGAMLLERCEPGTTLRTLPEPEQDVVIAGLLHRLWRLPEAPHPFRPLSTMMAYWIAQTEARAEHWSDPGLVGEGLRLFKELPHSASASVLLATDLHAGNVLRAHRSPWLVIDPKPFVGDPAYDATQHLLNCPARLRSDPDRLIRHFADLLSVDHDRVRLWLFARIVTTTDNWSDDSLMDVARLISPE